MFNGETSYLATRPSVRLHDALQLAVDRLLICTRHAAECWCLSDQSSPVLDSHDAS